jgi:hypothetical protein
LGGRKGQRIIEYIGPKLYKAKGLAELEKGNASLFALDEDDDIDGSVTWRRLCKACSLVDWHTCTGHGN